MISYLGDGLNIVISCDHIPGHNWMSYLCWYSIRQNLPDSKVYVICKRENVTGNLFLWAKKLGVFFTMYNKSNHEKVLQQIPKPLLVVSPYCMALRDFEESGYDFERIGNEDLITLQDTDLLCDAASDAPCTFCSYEKGWGHFITKDWINKVECPLSFFVLKKLSKKNMSLNEKRIENLWNSSLRLFHTVSGGVVQ